MIMEESARTVEREPVDTPLSTLVTADQKAWLDRAAIERQGSMGAIVRAAIETYRRLHPTLGRDD